MKSFILQSLKPFIKGGYIILMTNITREADDEILKNAVEAKDYGVKSVEIV